MSNSMVRGRVSNHSACCTKKEILIVDADLCVCEMLWVQLQQAGYQPCVAPTAQHAAGMIASRLPHALIVDWSLPDSSGLSLLIDLRAQCRTERLPVIMLGARDDEDDCVRALDAGADDFVCKPFSSRELILRLRVLLRPMLQRQACTRISMMGLTLDFAAMRVGSSADFGDTGLPLSAFECQLLHFFLTHGQRVYSRKEIIHALCGTQAGHDERSVDLHVCYLRKALRALGRGSVIETVRGRGYRLNDRVEPLAAH
ncbi:phosphate regulon transcriptional regulator PhoB [Paraburkholderia jirisanensis]